LDSDQIKTIEY